AGGAAGTGVADPGVSARANEPACSLDGIAAADEDEIGPLDRGAGLTLQSRVLTGPPGRRSRVALPGHREADDLGAVDEVSEMAIHAFVHRPSGGRVGRGDAEGTARRGREDSRSHRPERALVGRGGKVDRTGASTLLSRHW